jgi:beta-glucuronidase
MVGSRLIGWRSVERRRIDFRLLSGAPIVVLIVTVACVWVAAARAAQYAPEPPTKGAVTRDGQTDRYLLGGTWLFRDDPGDVGLAQGWWRDTGTTEGWSPVTMPNSFDAGDLSNISTVGWVGWYRRDFTLPAGVFARYVPAYARRWIIRFESVNYRATVWLNGRLVGAHAGAGLPFEFDLSGVRGGVNRLIVRVDNRRLPTDLPPGPSGWWTYGGVLREVYLRSVERADLSQVQVRPTLRCVTCAAEVSERVLVRNVTGVPEAVRLRGSFGSARLTFGSAVIAPHGTWNASASVRIPHPRLWSLDQPALYRATLTLSDSQGRPLGSYVTYSGVRRITVTRDGRLLLNGRVLHLRGVNLLEQDVERGSALEPGDLQRLVEEARALGATVIRAGPLSPEIEELADRDGLLIWSDIPVNQYVDLRYLADPSWIRSAHAVLEDDILANQNHPSLLVWSIGNELPTPASASEASYIAGAAALAHRLDPTRPVGMAVSDWPGVSCQAAYAPLDVIGFNDYFGWFDAGGGATDDRDALSPFLDSFRGCYPDKALFITEFGFDGNRNGPVEERGTYQFQANAAAFHLGVFASKPWLSGAMYFLLQDTVAFPGYSGGNPWPDPPFNQKGLLDLDGNPKPAWSVVASSYHQTVQIAPP